MEKRIICTAVCRTRSALCAALFLLAAASLWAQDGAGGTNPTSFPAGGFTGPGPATVTISDTRRLRDDSFVTLQGKIERALGDEKYLFSDGTGQIYLEIEQKVWQGLSVGPEDTVIISGELDKGWRTNKVEVQSIRKAE
jgi:uncharacterized protein (TIGR00156 family)